MPVDGVSNDFCVPSRFTIAAPPWVPEDKPGAPRGFAFGGCWHAGSDRLPCPFPETVIAGTVHGANHRSPTVYGDFDPDAFIRSVLRERDTTIRLDPSGRIVAAQNLRLWEDWYLWELGVPARAGEPISFSGSDRLVATCRFKDSVYKPISRGARNILCDRGFDSGPLAIRYSFEADDVFPRDLERMDAAVVAVLQGWQCR